MAALVKKSKVRFDEPWGMVCLFWAGGSPQTAYGKASTQQVPVERAQFRRRWRPRSKGDRSPIRYYFSWVSALFGTFATTVYLGSTSSVMSYFRTAQSRTATSLSLRR